MTQTSDMLTESPRIRGVFFRQIRAFPDDRGRFREAFRKEWFPWVNFDAVQSNYSENHAGALRGLHYHFHQVDYWYVTAGVIRVGLVDLRPSSPTYRAAQTLDIGEGHEIGVLIPVGVAHGFYALTAASMFYFVNQYYRDNSDEFGVAWDDPDLGLAWNLPGPPILSPRDRANPRLRDIPAEHLPQ